MDHPAAVLFDFDFTLGDSSAGIIDAANRALVAMGHAPAEEGRIRATIGRTLPDVYCILTGAEAAAERAAGGAEFARLFIARADETMAGLSRLYDEAVAAVSTLRERHGVRTGVVTTKLRRRVAEILARAGAADLFDVVIGLEDVHAAKPDPAGLLLAMSRLEVAPSRTVYVGDHAVDAEAAHRAGVGFIGVETGVHGRAGFGREVLCIPTLHDLEHGLRAWRGGGALGS